MYPASNKFRSALSLQGIWDFRFEDDDQWTCAYVPASYNNQVIDPRSRYYTGSVHYRTRFTIPEAWKGQFIILRFGSVTHDAQVFIDHELVYSHKGGFLPFEINLTGKVEHGKTYLLEVKASNRVDHCSLPVGNEEGPAFFGSDNPGIPSVEEAKKELARSNQPNFDFFNYSGITRSVWLCSMAQDHIEDITIVPALEGSIAIIDVSVRTSGHERPMIEILDEDGRIVSLRSGFKETLAIKNPKLWNPWPDKPYLYTAHITLSSDEYDIQFGIRTVKVEGKRFLVNGKPFYFKGVGKHEDSAIRGRGQDQCLNVMDAGLLHWLNANSFRTSHYPYAEEMYSLCDRQGIVIIDETPAVGLNFQGKKNPYEAPGLKAYHIEVLEQMIQRDKNHPSVVMWSLGNEPDTEHFPESARAYWQELYERAHAADPQNRPVTMVCCQNDYTRDLTTRTMDVVCLNRYYGWYNLSGRLDLAKRALDQELDWWQAIGKPLMLTEYGADALPGLHSVEPEMFSEEFQAKYLETMNAALDKRDFVIGEQAWNFADFDAQQGPMRPGGNHKGLFTQDRKPKMAAHLERRRWALISNWTDKAGITQ
jgi:beta-glucuronidase